jgi:hypothetical protein
MDHLKPGNEVKPTQGGPNWVNADYRPPFCHRHLVSDSDNWAALGERYRKPVQTMLAENFRSTNPYHVNWYLREYVKCDRATPDRYNWRFSTASRYKGGPRAGTIFIVPNWDAIGAAAKQATKDAISEWFKTARFGPANIEGMSLLYGPGSVHGGTLSPPRFTAQLMAGGAPAPLIDAWLSRLSTLLETFTGALAGEHKTAFPMWFGPGAQAAVPMRATPWTVAQGGAPYSLFSPPALRPIIQGLACNGPGAERCLNAYGAWLDRAMRQAVPQITAVNVMGSPQPTNGGMRGQAQGVGVVYSAVNLPD